MSNPRCDLCGDPDAVGFIQLYEKDTGTVIDDVMGPNVCNACATTMCDDGDITKIE